MTIGKRLYWGFGAVLAIMAFLLVINIFTVMRQYSARDAVEEHSGRRTNDRERPL